MTPVGRDTATFCTQHIEFVQEIARLKTQQEELQREKVNDAEKIRELEQTVAHLKGFYEGAVPKLQQDVSTIFRLADERNEQAQLYQGQVRALAQKVEDVGEDLGRGLERKADKQLFDAKILNVYRWVTVGFVGWGLTVLGVVLYAILAKMGVKTP